MKQFTSILTSLSTPVLRFCQIALLGITLLMVLGSNAEARQRNTGHLPASSSQKSAKPDASGQEVLSQNRPLANQNTPSITTPAKRLDRLETSLFAVSYPAESAQQRVERLEKTLFGQAQSGNLPIEKRISQLEDALSPQAMGALSPTEPVQQSAQNTPSSPESSSVPAESESYQIQPQSVVSQETEATDYPAVTQIEQKQLGKTYEKEDITVRLARLEKNVFQQVQSGSLSERVDHLRLIVLGDTGTLSNGNAPVYSYNGNQYSVQSPLVIARPGQQSPLYTPQSQQQQQQNYPVNPYYGAGAYNRFPNHTGSPFNAPMNPYNGQGRSPVTYQPRVTPDVINPNASSADMINAITSIEQDVLHNSYPAEPLNTRLDRLEQKVFNSTSPELTPEARMDRIIAVASAGGNGRESYPGKTKGTFMNLLPIILTILPMLLL
jgi:hypothetical protein